MRRGARGAAGGGDLAAAASGAAESSEVHVRSTSRVSVSSIWSWNRQKQSRVGVQLPQGGYSPLASPFLLVGLGLTNDYVEQLMVGARHIEVQVVGDGSGQVVVLGERDCSVQRQSAATKREQIGPHIDLTISLANPLAGTVRKTAPLRSQICARARSVTTIE